MKEKRSDNWYSCLLHDIKSGCKSPEEILKNKVNFITFNYDMSLEYYLFSRLKNTSYFKDVCDTFLNELEIIHVYGQFYSAEKWKEYGIQLENNSFITPPQINTKIMLRAAQIYQNIKLIGERNGYNYKIQNILQKSSRLIIIGFGFDSNNLDILGLKNMKGLEYRLCDKKIYYLDYEGRMNKIYNDFLFLKGKQYFQFFRSTETSIVNAYEYDFKLSLVSNDEEIEDVKVLKPVEQTQ